MKRRGFLGAMLAGPTVLLKGPAVAAAVVEAAPLVPPPAAAVVTVKPVLASFVHEMWTKNQIVDATVECLPLYKKLCASKPDLDPAG